jgi:small subunit ribosomal protein S1
MSKEVIRPQQYRHTRLLDVVYSQNTEFSDEQLQELADLYQGSLEVFQQGKLITGNVIASDEDGVLVDIGYKSRGLIPRYEFAEHELKKMTPGQEIEVILDLVENVDGNVVLSYEKAKAMRAWEEITKLFDEGKPVQGVVTNKVRGGLSVDVGIPAFLPGSQIDLQRVTDFDRYVGQTVVATVLKMNKKRGNIIISRRKYLNDQRSEVRKKILDTLEVSQVIQGFVKNITNYGVFIDIGGVDGLLHITDMTWGRISHPSEVVRVGDMLTVKVLSFDKVNEKISLGLKQLQDNPWEQMSQSIAVGDKIVGRISSITDYGLFVEVAKDVEGLVHISEVSWTDRISSLHGRFHVGQEINVLVVSLDKENRRMSLSIKQLEQNPWKAINDQFKVDQKIRGKITNITDFGIFVQLLPGIDGLVHVSDLSWLEHIQHPSDRYSVGQEIEAVILAIDVDNKKVSLSVKKLTPDPWADVVERYPVGSVAEGEITKITNFGAFVKLDTGVEGLIHNTVLGQEEHARADEFFKVGQKAFFRVLNVNKDERKLSLSTQLESKKEKLQQQNEEPYQPLGNDVPSNKAKRVKHSEVRSTNVPSMGSSKVKSSLQLALESLNKHDDADRTKSDE